MSDEQKSTPEGVNEPGSPMGLPNVDQSHLEDLARASRQQAEILEEISRQLTALTKESRRVSKKVDRVRSSINGRAGFAYILALSITALALCPSREDHQRAIHDEIKSQMSGGHQLDRVIVDWLGSNYFGPEFIPLAHSDFVVFSLGLAFDRVLTLGLFGQVIVISDTNASRR